MSLINYRVYFASILALIFCITRSAQENSLDGSDHVGGLLFPRVAILVSPARDQFLELYWDVEQVTQDDWVGLFDQDPLSNNKAIPIYTVKVENQTGYNITNIKSKQNPKIDELSFQSECVGFWAAYFTNNGNVKIASCFKTNPTWMYDMKGLLENVQIKQMFIPGTHDSGAYVTDDKKQNLIDRYVYTQDQTIKNQLIHGIRYLDLRVSYLDDTDELWWLNHGPVKIRPLQGIFDDIKSFLQNTKEIVNVDFHGFPKGFGDDLKIHREFVTYVKSQLSEWMAPPNWNATCGQLWALNKTLIISYNKDNVVDQYPDLLWRGVQHKWGNVQKLKDLRKYLTEVFSSPPQAPTSAWSAMAELTASPWGIVSQKTKGLKKMACSVNIEVTNWFRDSWGKTCNVVAVDFFRGTDIIHTAIEWNIRRYWK